MAGRFRRATRAGPGAAVREGDRLPQDGHGGPSGAFLSGAFLSGVFLAATLPARGAGFALTGSGRPPGGMRRYVAASGVSAGRTTRPTNGNSR